MWKPRSKIQTGKKSAFSAFRNIGGQQWRRRYVCLDNGQFCYGKSKDELNKAIRLDTITGVARLSRSMLEAEKAPQSFLQFGWVLYSSDRRILFCCEDEPSVTSWVTFLEQHVTRDKNSMDKDQRNKRIMEDFLANDFGALAVGNDKNRPQTTDHPNPPYTAQPSSISVPSVDIKVDEDSSESDSTDDSAVSSVSSEEEEVAVDVSIDDASDLSQPPVPLTAAQEALVREASSTHVYLASQHAELSSHFRAVDTIADIVFSSTVEVFGQNEKWKTKKIAVARHHVYVFGKKGHLMMQDVVVKSLSMRKITGVLTSSSDDTLLAILLPTSHDKLLRFIPQKRDGEPVAAGTVCAQFRAHLFKIYYETLSTTVHRPFLMLGVHDIYKSIHANAEDRFPPLRASPLDSLEVSHSCDAVSRSLRTFADTDVFWSSAATDHTVKPVNVVFVITNTAVYTLDMQKSTVITRFPLDMMTSMYYCVSEGSIVFYAFSKKSQTLRIDPVSSKDVAFIAQAVGALLLELFTRDAKAEDVKELLPLVVVRSGEHPFALRVQEINLESSVREDTNAMATKNAFNWKNMRKEASKYLAQFNKGNAKKDVLAEVPQSTDVDSNEEVIKPVDAKASRTVQESLTEYGQFTSLLKSSAEQYTRWNQLNLAENSGDSFLLNKEPVAAGSIIFSCEAKLWSAKECHVWTKAMMNESPANQWSAKAYGSKCVFLITTEGIVLIASSADDVQKIAETKRQSGRIVVLAVGRYTWGSVPRKRAAVGPIERR
ncbi:PH domain containing protein, putative [Angomonas deanei]|uniref:PH domain containing protein, putative n=1 Tax=Angomonas deanei TaxID=59799 RepID=A0A7G2CK37_9TRYP|nr:PH domain containing protein, putative [Angomonas deanei]